MKGEFENKTLKPVYMPQFIVLNWRKQIYILQFVGSIFFLLSEIIAMKIGLFPESPAPHRF